jgi:hypothetical protein
VQLVRLLLLLHVGVTAALLLLLSLVVLGQAVRAAVARRTRATGAPAALVPAPSPLVPASGASVLDWTVDLRGVGQREAALRT